MEETAAIAVHAGHGLQFPNDFTGPVYASAWSMDTEDRRYVYILRSDRNPQRHYVGLTSDMAKRLEWHNAGKNVHTFRDRPWSVIVTLNFETAVAARHFEKYLKTGSGRAFAKRHFV